jgi:polysaccharide deacetylase 2 family uncharacterized protein YibQ
MINNIPIFFCLILYSLSIKPDINIINTDNSTTYNGKAVIIIDDLGNQYKPCLPLIKSKFPVTFSVLPNCPFSKRISQEGHESGHEIILHAPMEAWDNESNLRASKPGNMFLTTAMDNQDLTDHLEAMIESVPNIIGISNHMGSKFTEDSTKMEVLIRLLKDKNLCFVDSRTSNNSKGLSLAKEFGVPSVGRGLFLDNDQTYDQTVKQLIKLMEISEAKGTAVGIGHPYPSTIKAITDMLPRFKKNKIEIVPLSEILN